jgi:hypothetical protein
MKKQLTAVALATMVSGSVFAVCSANIDMGGKDIVNIGTENVASSDLATKEYVDAADKPSYCDSMVLVDFSDATAANVAQLCSDHDSEFVPMSVSEIVACNLHAGLITPDNTTTFAIADIEALTDMTSLGVTIGDNTAYTAKEFIEYHATANNNFPRMALRYQQSVKAIDDNGTFGLVMIRNNWRSTQYYSMNKTVCRER